MILVENWRAVLTRSHSMWAIYLGALALLGPDIIYLASGIDTNPRLWVLLALAIFFYGGLGRVKKQRGVSGD